MSFETLSKLDEQDNNGLMTALFQQSDRLAEILNEMNSFSSREKETLLTQTNKSGFNASLIASNCQRNIELRLNSFSETMNEYYGETVDASAQNIYESLQTSWELYDANPADAELEKSFEWALARAQPLFNEVDDNNEIIKTLFRWFKNFVSIFVTVDWSEKTYDNMKDAAQSFERVKGIVEMQKEVEKPVAAIAASLAVPAPENRKEDTSLDAAIAASLAPSHSGLSFFSGDPAAVAASAPPASDVSYATLFDAPVEIDPSAPPADDDNAPSTPPPSYSSN